MQDNSNNIQSFIISKRYHKILTNVGFVLFLACLYKLFFPSKGYDIEEQLFAIIGLYPVFVMFLIFLFTKKIAFGIFFLTVFQTWNMFLSPFLGAKQMTATLRTINPESLFPMGFFCMLSIFTLFWGFLYGIKNISVHPFWKSTELYGPKIKKVLIICLILGVSLTSISSALSLIGLQISFLSSIDSMMPAVVAALLTMYYLREGKNVLLFLFSIIYLLICFISDVGGTLFINIIILILGPVIAYINEKKKIPYVAILGTVVLLMPIYLTRHDYRNVGLYLNGNMKYEWGMKILKDNYSNFSINDITDNLTNSGENKYHDNRFEGVTYLGQVVHCHQDLGYSFKYGETFVWLPTMFLPRMFLPIRPGQNMGDNWAEYYGLKDKSWNCSINFPMLVEFYANFGWIGMIVLSWLNGYAICWVMSLFNFGKGDLNLLLLLFISLKLIVVEANITLNYGLIIQVLFICWIIKKYQQRNIETL